MVVSLVDKDGKTLKVFATGCFEKDLKDFSWKEKWFIRPLGKWQSYKYPSQSYYHYQIMRHLWSTQHLCCKFFILVDTRSQYLSQLEKYFDHHVLTTKFSPVSGYTSKVAISIQLGLFAPNGACETFSSFQPYLAILLSAS